MRSIPFVGALAVAMFGFLAAPIAVLAGEVVTLGRAEAPIREVTVYTGQALVKRIASFELKSAGDAKIVLAKLPAWVSDDSVRVRSEAGTTLMGSRVVAQPVNVSSLPAAQALADVLREAARTRRALEDEAAVHAATIAQVEAIRKAQAVEESRWIKAGAEELTALVAWAEKAHKEALAGRRAVEEKLQALTENEALAHRKLAELTSAAGRTEKDIEVELTAAAPGKYRIEVEYVTGGASWRPFYDLRADGDAKAIDVTYMGVVKQETGEDWEGVKLALSTARPELGARPPELVTLGVGMRRPVYYDSYSGSGRTLAGASAPSAPLAEAAPASTPEEPKFVAGLVQEAEVEARGATVAFQIPSKETIPSDGKDKRTTIGKSSWKTDNRYVTVPKLSPFAYLKSNVTNGFAYPLLAGEANVFFGPDYVGKSRVDLVPAGEKLDVYLGVDERVAVERKTEKRFRDTKGIFTTDVRERFEIKIPIKNSRDVPIQITVIDQVPVSRDEDVRIEDASWSPEVVKDPKDEKDAKLALTGERRWEITVPAKGEAAVALKYTVRFPLAKESQLVGLER